MTTPTIARETGMPTRSSHRTTRTSAPINYSALTPHTAYITKWSEEQEPPYELIERPGRGIGYLDETLWDRDDHGVLWKRTPHLPGHGQPKFKIAHPLRQRRAMQRVLCGVCGGLADQNDEGTLWLIHDDGSRWPGWPDGAESEPPTCAPCVRVAARLCPALRHNGAVALRVRHAPISGVFGQLYRSNHGRPMPTEQMTVRYNDPKVQWVLASKLIRELVDCTVVPLEEACRNSTAN